MKINMMNIGKKATSLIMLSFGLFFLEIGVRAALVTYYVLTTSTTQLHLSPILFHSNSLIYTAFGIIIIALASFFWGFKKDLKIFGIFLCIVSLNFIVQSIDTLVHPLFTDMRPFNNTFPTSVVVGFIICAVCFFVIGILLVRREKRNRDAVNALSHA